MNRQEPEMDAPANSGLVRSNPGNNFGPVGVQWITFNFCPPNSPNTVGDGRASFLVNSDWNFLNNITNALWQGRQTDTVGRAQNFSSLWGERDHVRADIPLGTALSVLSADPTAIPSTYTASHAQTAPAYVRNGPMQSIGELGHIFDPAQVNNTGTSASGGSPANYFRPAGGRSLRIGQPEFTFGGGANSWDREGLRAIQLIDLFSVNASNAASQGYPASHGRVNINTAPLEVIEALFLNIRIASDPSADGATIGQAHAAFLANRLITNRPYSRLSDLSRILPDIATGSNYSPAIAQQTGGGTTNLDLMDRAREEVFGKFVETATIQSRAFRVFVLGQALDPRTGKVLSQSLLDSVIALDPSPGGFPVKIQHLRSE